MSNFISQASGILGFRRVARRAKDFLLASLGCPQAYADLAKVARSAPDVSYIDIGCHHGLTVQRFLDSAGCMPVFAFDPNEDNLLVAKRTVRSQSPVSFIQAAVADVDGRQPFHDNMNGQTSSLLANAAGNLRSYPVDTKPVATKEVDVVRLDTWAKKQLPYRRAIVKSDTQGAEAKVILGGMNFLREQTLAFYGEVFLDEMYEGQPSFQELRDLLEGNCGLVLHNVYPCLHDRDGRAIQLDALWVSPKVLAGLKTKPHNVLSD
jgi:FkbM family methyltransferase